MKTIRIGTRGSKLALVQAEQVKKKLEEEHHNFSFELAIIRTTGDRILDAPLSKIGDKGLFTKEIEKELLDGTIDCAVHSMKDMPTALPEGCIISAVTERLNPRDAFISDKGITLKDLKRGMTVATSSLRRRAQLLAFCPDLSIADMRGNVQSRIRKMREHPNIDGIVLACAGITRLGMEDEITEIVTEEVLIPPVGQASLAIETREGDSEIAELVSVLNHEDSSRAIRCERSFLEGLHGGCQVPIAGYARCDSGRITLTGMVASLDGQTMYRRTVADTVGNGLELGKALARALLDEGARTILEDIYGYTLE